jgi:hypothetical protein
MTSRRMKRFSFKAASLAAVTARVKLGCARVTRIPMIETTMRISIRVKPRRKCRVPPVESREPRAES